MYTTLLFSIDSKAKLIPLPIKKLNNSIRIIDKEKVVPVL